jgi:hypothetical protein
MSATSDQLADLDAIRQLKARYCRLLDTKRWERMRGEVFAPDARFEGFSSGMGSDLDAWLASASEALAEIVSVHHVHQPEIVLTGPDTARGVWAMYDLLERMPAGSGHGLHGYGHYEEEYRRGPDGWRIAFMRLTRLRIDRFGEPFQAGGASAGLRVSDDWLGKTDI